MLSKTRRLYIMALSLLLAVTFSGGVANQQANAAATPKSAVRLSGGEKCFKDTGKCMHGIFLGYWQDKGGLAQFGYPITDELTEEGRTVQYTERARFEWHPQFRDTPNEVLLSLLGTQLVAGRNEAAFRRVPAPASGVYFAQTGHTLKEPFLSYWQSRGGLPVYGYPVSEAFDEKSPTDGKTYQVQYFERNRLEYHPEAKGTPSEIQLGLLGREFYKRIYGNAAPPPPSPYPVSIDALQQMQRAGGNLRIVRTVATTAAYTQSAITYKSGNLTITGQMFVPNGEGPFPVMIMNHGFIPIEDYTSGMDSRRESPFVASNGYVAIHPDFRNYAGSDDDENASVNLTAFGWADDSLNLVDAVKRSDLPFLDKKRIGFWGHSNGGQLSMMAFVAQRQPDIKAFVLFAPTSPDYADNFNRWTRPRTEQAALVRERHGWPEDNPDFYRNLSVGPHFKEAVTKGPILLFHGTGDTNTPYSWSERTVALMKEAGVDVTFVSPRGENHLFSDAAWRGGVASQFLAFIEKHVKGAK
ncbi:MAG TPA: prolyl oligopeptidase family serine peptidase [Chloroflexia bacterium]|nr:prolyl oligopeptidase family serine peptidase [Chloroflexia bacterium]